MAFEGNPGSIRTESTKWTRHYPQRDGNDWMPFPAEIWERPKRNAGQEKRQTAGCLLCTQLAQHNALHDQKNPNCTVFLVVEPGQPRDFILRVLQSASQGRAYRPGPPALCGGLAPPESVHDVSCPVYFSLFEPMRTRPGFALLKASPWPTLRLLLPAPFPMAPAVARDDR